MTGPIRVRTATVADAPALARHRVEMFVAMGSLARDSAEVPVLLRATEDLARSTLPSGAMASWIAEDDAGVVGSGSALLERMLPRPGSPAGGEQAYLLSFFTEPHARRRGVATAVMRACLAWCRDRGIGRVLLHASAAGRPVYERLGFVPREGEMMWHAASAARKPVPSEVPCPTV